MHEMEYRHYDPAIARFNVIDPVTHHDFSPYNVFDNNPVYWADPNGADATSDAFRNDDSDTMKRAHWSDAYTGKGPKDEGGKTSKPFSTSGLKFAKGSTKEFKNKIKHYYNQVYLLPLGRVVLDHIAKSGTVHIISEVGNYRLQKTTPEVSGSGDSETLTGNSFVKISTKMEFVVKEQILTKGLSNFAHEIMHSFQVTLGDNTYLELHKNLDGSGVKYSEVQAVGFENYVKGNYEPDLPPRKSYTEQKLQTFRGWDMRDYMVNKKYDWFYIHITKCKTGDCK